ncbi:MAG: response regulator [Planctomycetes bacterium]|nr:response regulator [Planctomycetota bacterium]
MNAEDDAALDSQQLRRRVSELEALVGLHDLDAWLRALFENMFEGIQIIDFDWRYLYLNRAAAAHGRRPREELTGQKMVDMYPGIERTDVFRLMERCMAERAPQQMVNQFTYPDGRKAWFDLRINAVPMGILVLSVDISAQKAIEQSQKMEAIGRLAGGVAHDFNNLLTVINGYSEMLLSGTLDEPSAREILQQIRHAGEKASSLTRQLLAFSRKQILQPKILDVNTVVDHMDKILRRIIGEDIELITKLRPHLEPVTFDPGQLDQIILNLAVNARDAMPHGGKLILETAHVELDEEYARAHPDARPGPHVMIAMTDTGTGMDAETRAKIFEPFFTTKALGKGTGLGLSTVYGIVKQSGGNIWVYSEPGRGTTFKVYLPRSPQAAVPAAAGAAVAAPRRGTETILVVEDEAAVRKLIQRVLEKEGYTVLEAGDVDEAVARCEQYRGDIHLLLTDMVLPKMDGRKLAERILSLRPSLKVAYMSGYADEAIFPREPLEPGRMFIEKPITPTSLLAKLREFLS